MSTQIVVSGQTIDSSVVKSMPANRKFRDAWILNGQIIDINMPRAVEIWKNKMRTARAPIMDKLDSEFFRALETGDKEKQDEITALKQELRNVTSLPELAAAKTVAELEMVWPECLGLKPE